ncbi:MAG: LCP family protein, partial [Firmicutes bacterium]|nr:LCP family protein [Bacillota bacterium]
MSIIDNNPDNATQVLNDLTENVDSLAEDKGIVPEGNTKPGGIKRFFHWIHSWRTWVKILVLMMIIFLLTGGVVAMTAVKTVEDVMQVMNKDAEIPEDYDLSLQPIDGFINILLLGVDTRNMDEIKGSRSDMIMVASINTETYEVTLTSVYRDTYLKLGDTPTYDKITHACVYGGPEMTIKSLNQAMDLNIEQYAIVNFKAVADVVDAIGGITVNVQDFEIDQLNKYTKETARAIGKKKGTYKLVTEPGKQKLEGVQAVSYGRIRKGVGDDFKRTERMRIVVNKVFKKLKKMSFSQFKEVVNVVVPQCRTNMKFNDILALGMDIT